MALSDVRLLVRAYRTQTPAAIQSLDAYLLFSAITGLVQMACLVVVSTRPAQHFIGSLLASLACFAVTAHVRMRAAETLRTRGAKAALVPLTAAVELVVANMATHMFIASMLTSNY